MRLKKEIGILITIEEAQKIKEILGASTKHFDLYEKLHEILEDI